MSISLSSSSFPRPSVIIYLYSLDSLNEENQAKHANITIAKFI